MSYNHLYLRNWDGSFLIIGIGLTKSGATRPGRGCKKNNKKKWNTTNHIIHKSYDFESLRQGIPSFLPSFRPSFPPFLPSLRPAERHFLYRAMRTGFRHADWLAVHVPAGCTRRSVFGECAFNSYVIMTKKTPVVYINLIENACKIEKCFFFSKPHVPPVLFILI